MTAPVRFWGPARRWWVVTGAEGLIMLAAALLLAGLAAGVPLVVAGWHVVAVGRRAATTPAVPGIAIVPGKAARHGTIDHDFRLRLERARRLHGAGLAPQVILLGGCTRSAAVSEAGLGHDRLVTLGVERGCIVIEERSRHTLENLSRLRALLPALGGGPLVLVSSRYHLARCAAMATELGLPLELCAAEPGWPVRTWPRVLSEAFFLHWYTVGRLLSRRLRYRRALARIT